MDPSQLDPALLELLHRPAPEAAPALLGCLLSSITPEGRVTVRLTEVEAYGGPAETDLPDPGAHTYHGRTARNASMFGPPGHAYVYFTYGLHHALNLVCRPEGMPGGCLLRAGEVVEGLELAVSRRSARRATVPSEVSLARGPGNLAQALGLGLDDDGAVLHGPGAAGVVPRADLGGPERLLILEPGTAPTEIATTPRTGVSGEGGTERFPWRFAAQGDPTVSPYRRATPKKRRTRGGGTTMDG